jgi:tRNA dimethylallyltransferase
MADRPGAILIAGPTASGKSALGLEKAAKTGGIIVNADSMQVYRQLSVLTARPQEGDLAVAEHVLYGHVDAGADWSVALWLADAGKALSDARRQGRAAVFVGGTGLYFKALVEGLSEIPQPDPAVRAHWRQVALDSPEALHGELAKRDPQAAALLGKGDRQRLVRALEVFDTTGRSMAHFRAEGARRALLSGQSIEKILVEPPRDELHRRINARVDRMFDEGAVDEVRALLALGLDREVPAMKAIGVREIGELISGSASIDETKDRLKAATRQYAKRQSTWFRHQGGEGWRKA